MYIEVVEEEVEHILKKYSDQPLHLPCMSFKEVFQL